MTTDKSVYLGNPNLKKANATTNFTPEQWRSLLCSQDPVYLSKIISRLSLDDGVINFNLYDFQEKMVTNFHENRFNIAKLPRQSGKSTVVTAYLLWYVIFTDNVNVAILANKAATAREMLGRLQLSYENLPKWMQGIIAEPRVSGTGERALVSWAGIYFCFCRQGYVFQCYFSGRICVRSE